MSKSSRARSRKSQREQTRKRQQTYGIIGGAVILAVIIVAALALNNGGLGANARYELDPILGDPDAPVTIVEYGAYGCPSCKQFHDIGIIEELVEEYPGQVRFIFRDMPIIMPDYSQRSAEVAQCALDQGQELYWEYHDAVYTHATMGSASREELIAIGALVEGLNMERFQTCALNGEHRNTVLYDLQRGQELGIRGAPVFFINGQRLMQFSPDGIRNMVEAELSRLGLLG